MKDKFFNLLKKLKVLFDTYKIAIGLLALLGLGGVSYLGSSPVAPPANSPEEPIKVEIKPEVAKAGEDWEPTIKQLIKEHVIEYH